MKRHIITAAALVFALTACGAQDTAPPEDPSATADVAGTPTTLTQGTYEYELDGGKMVLEIPAAPDSDESIAKIENLRAGLKSPEVTYILGDADNRNGSGKLSPSEVSLYDMDGKEYLFSTASTYIGDSLSPTMTEDYEYAFPDGSPMTEAEYDELNALSVETYNEHLNQGDPGSRAAQLWVYEGTDLPDEFTNLTVSEGAETIMPTPVE